TITTTTTTTTTIITSSLSAPPPLIALPPHYHQYHICELKLCGETMIDFPFAMIKSLLQLDQLKL
ncbi:hypothetical protein WUBG_03562, partial [Wuchereria bancrofti]